MFFPKIERTSSIGTGVSENFAGLNRSNYCLDNEFADMKNCGIEQFPYVCPRPSRKHICHIDDKIESLIPPIDASEEEYSFSGIAGGKLYYRGEAKAVNMNSTYVLPYPYSDVSKYPELHASIKSTIVPAVDELYLFPACKSYNVLGLEKKSKSNRTSLVEFVSFETDDDEDRSDKTGYSYIEWVKPLDVNTSYSKRKFGYVDEVDIVAGDPVIISYNTDRNVNNCTFYPDNPLLAKHLVDDYQGWNESRESIKRIVGATVIDVYTETLDSGRAIITGFKLELFNIAGDRASFVTYNGNSSGKYTLDAETANFRIIKYIPDFEHTCNYVNRIFALDPYGKNIHCSTYSDLTNFTKTDAQLMDTSWQSGVTSPGKWTGIIACGTYLYAFKSDIVYVLYGDNPQNFTIGKSFSPGCIDGRSICAINNYVYWLGPDGFYRYSASVPAHFDQKLGSRKYKSAVSAVQGSKIYISATDDEDNCELIIYDTEKEVFVIEDDLRIVDFCTYKDKLYAATEHDVYKFDDECEEDFEYSITSKLFTDATSYLRSVVSLNFRMKFEPGSDASIYISYDGSPWKMCGYLINGKLYHTNDDFNPDRISQLYDSEKIHKPDTVYVQRVPVRFRASNTYQYKIVCHGKVIIEAIERNVIMAGQEMR